LNLTHTITEAGTIGWIVNAIALLAFVKQPTLRKLFPAMAVYLGFKFVSDVALISLMQVHHLFTPVIMYNIYFTLYWLSFLVGSVALFYAVRQAFDHLMEPLQGLKKVGQVFFRWIAIISVIVVAATALHPYGFSVRAIPLAMIELMRCTSMLELFLLAFLALTVHRLGLSYKSHVFGLGLGLGLLAATDFVASAMTRFGTGMVSTVSLLGEIGSICAFILWFTYFLISEPVRRSLMMPASSQLLRWNEIALALGHTGGQVVMTPAPKPFFLDEVERTVDRVLSRNSIDAN
jgi:hypothetical protein